MKIAIFGDSFADDRISGFHANSEIGWAQHLRDNFNYTIDNYSESGTSLYSAWKKFNSLRNTKKYHEYNYILFFITGWGRYELTADNQIFRITSYTQAEVMLELKELNLTNRQRLVIETYKNYMLYCRDDNRERLFHYLLKKEIISDPNIYYHDTSDWDDDNCMVKLSQYELTIMKNSTIKTFDDEQNWMREYQDVRVNHFTKKNNFNIANVIHQHLIKKNKHITFDRSVIEEPDLPIDRYFRKYSK